MSISGGTAPGVADPVPAGQPGGPPCGAALRGRGERSRHLLAWSAAAAVLFACYLRVSGTVPVNSDGASDALQAWDMLHGNPLLHGWRLGDVSYFTTELPQYALLELALGLHSSVVHVAGAMTYTLMVLLAALLAQGTARGTAGTGRALIAAGIMLAPQLGGGAFLLLLSPDHVGSAVPVLAAFLILDRAPRRWYVPVSVAALLAVALVADRVVLLTGILPLAAVCSARSYLGAVRQRLPWASQRYQLSLGGAALASVAVAWLVQAVLDAKGGYHVAPLGIISVVSSVTQLPGVLYSDAQAVLLLFGGDFLAQPAGLLTGMALVHLAGVSLAGCAVWIGARRWRELDLVSACLAAAVLINGAAYVLLTQFDDVLGAREIAAVLPFGAVLAGRLLGARLARHRLRPLALLLLACYLACLGYAVAQPPAPVADQHLADWLAARHLRSGLAAYWQASGTTLASGGHIQVSPVCATKGRFTAEKWESKASWYDPRRREASFLILGGQPAACNDATAAQARSAFGPPARSYQIGPYAVLVWRRNLLTMVSDVRFLQDAAASVQLTGVISVIERTAVFLGLRTVVYPAPDLAASRAWWTAVLGVQPYFDQPFYVGFNPGGYELGLDPNADPSVGPRTYWGVRNIAAAAERMIATGAVAVEAVQEVGEGIKLGTFRSPAGDLAGLIENPVFKLQPTPIAESDGPGR